MRNSGMLWAMSVALVAMAIPGYASAETQQIVVDGRAEPWSVLANPDLDFGLHDGTAPAVLWSIRLVPGTAVHIEATGGTRAVVANESVGPDGYPNEFYDDRPGNTGRFMPSRYADKATYPANLNVLIGAFIDGDGRVVGKPFLIGRERTVEIPDGAMAVSLGMNDDRFSDNDGKLTVTVKSQIGNVIVGP